MKMSASTLKYVQLVDDNKFAIAKILQSGDICEIQKTTNGLIVSKIKENRGTKGIRGI